MTKHTVALLEGESENRPLIDATRAIVSASGVDLEWRPIYVEPFGDSGWSDEEWQRITAAIKSLGLALTGPMGDHRDPSIRSPHVELRERCGCFAGIRPVRSIKGLTAQIPDLDLVVIRETTEDVYAGHEHEVMRGGVSTLKVVTVSASQRIARYAFEYAQRHGRKKVSIIHKANIMKLTDGLFLETAREVAAGFPDIEVEDLIVDNASMQMVLRPKRYDVILCGNLYGDILSALAAGLVGGVTVPQHGVAIGDDVTIFEALRNLRTNGLGETSNPLPVLLPALDLLSHLGEEKTRSRIFQAVETVLQAGTTLTPDLGGSASCMDMADAIIQALK